jgi:hypothetical protein
MIEEWYKSAKTPKVTKSQNPSQQGHVAQSNDEKCQINMAQKVYEKSQIRVTCGTPTTGPHHHR